MSLTTSEVNLYPISNLTPRKNFYIDDIESFLDQYEDTKTTLVNFQYVKHALTLTIKINWTQEALSFDLGKYGYLSIKNSDDTKVVYYFVMNRKWLGQSTIQLELAMDTINTLRYGTDYILDDKTKINRQHKDRFIKVPASSQTYDLVTSARTDASGGGLYTTSIILNKEEWIGTTEYDFAYTIDNPLVGLTSYTFDGNTGELTMNFQNSGSIQEFTIRFRLDVSIPARYFRKIDIAQEGITPILYGEDLDILEDSDNYAGIDWHLLYTGSTAITAYAAPSGSVDVLTAGSKTINATDLTTGVYYYIIYDQRHNYPPVEVTMAGQTGHTGRTSSYLYMFVYYRSGTDIVMTQMKFKHNAIGGWDDAKNAGTRTAASFDISSSAGYVSITMSSALLTSYSQILAATAGTINISGFSLNTLYDYTTIDRTDDKHLKLLLLPYKPFEEIDGVVVSGWNYDSTTHFLQLTNLSSPLQSTINTQVESPLLRLEIDLSDINDEDQPDPDFESKLFHSDYYQPKFVYDSFSFVFALERVDIASYAKLNEHKFSFSFSCTNTINSRFLFTFPSYIVKDKNLEDYENILYVGRNNEEVLYNSAYISYIKNGYNYDVKTKERQEIGQWVGIGITSVGAIASFAATGFTGGVSAAAGISLATSTMAQLVSAVNTTAQAEANMNQKLYQLRQQKAAVSSADAVDLMQEYTGNKAKLMLYRVSDRMLKTLWDLFFYTGYVDGTLGIPNVTSRRRFNFVSCEPVFSWTKNIPEDILTDIELKFNAGVTFIHHYNDEWDLDQSHENYETSLI